MNPADLHRGGPVLATGLALGQATKELILLHGRGDSAAGILGLGHTSNQDEIDFGRALLTGAGNQ